MRRLAVLRDDSHRVAQRQNSPASLDVIDYHEGPDEELAPCATNNRVADDDRTASAVVADVTRFL